MRLPALLYVALPLVVRPALAEAAPPLAQRIAEGYALAPIGPLEAPRLVGTFGSQAFQSNGSIGGTSFVALPASTKIRCADAANVYFTTATSVVRVPILGSGGGAAAEVVADGFASAPAVTCATDFVLVAGRGDDNHCRIQRAAAGAPTTVVLDVPSALTDPESPAITRLTASAKDARWIVTSLGRQIFVTDGTSAGTKRLHDDAEVHDVHAVDGEIDAVAIEVDNGQVADLTYVTDGNAMRAVGSPGPTLVVDALGGVYQKASGRLDYFAPDGTKRHLVDGNVSFGGSVGGRYYFTLGDIPMVSDGTAAGTVEDPVRSTTSISDATWQFAGIDGEVRVWLARSSTATHVVAASVTGAKVVATLPGGTPALLRRKRGAGFLSFYLGANRLYAIGASGATLVAEGYPASSAPTIIDDSYASTALLRLADWSILATDGTPTGTGIIIPADYEHSHSEKVWRTESHVYFAASAEGREDGLFAFSLPREPRPTAASPGTNAPDAGAGGVDAATTPPGGSPSGATTDDAEAQSQPSSGSGCTAAARSPTAASALALLTIAAIASAARRRRKASIHR